MQSHPGAVPRTQRPGANVKQKPSLVREPRTPWVRRRCHPDTFTARSPISVTRADTATAQPVVRLTSGL